ncbi:hypothetical protein ABZ369_16935, partial [Streptomyces sp. NPDC005918]
PLPAPFDVQDRVGRVARRVMDDPAVPDTTVPPARPEHPAIRQQFLALPALTAAVEDDPLQAALDALFAAAVTYGSDYGTLFAEARSSFPEELGPAAPAT